MLDTTHELKIIRLPERIDASTIAAITQQFQTQILEKGGVILDMSQTELVEPEMATVILEGLNLAKQRSTQLSLMAVRASVAHVLIQTGVLQHFRRHSQPKSISHA
jgi:anti-anti-sigma regulatory factor